MRRCRATERHNQAVLAVVSGPIASGKSTVTRSLAQELERRGETVAAIDIDIVYEMLEHTSGPKDDPSKWSRARRAAAALADVLLDEGVTVVIVDGDFVAAPDRAEFTAALHAVVEPQFVTLRVSFDEAFRRASNDSARGLSRERAFLAAYYEAAAAALDDPPSADLVVDTMSITAAEAAHDVADWVCSPSESSARARRTR